MSSKEYLTFRLHNLRYAIEATLVQEILPIPEFIPVTETTAKIMGLFNLRGKIMPIVHIDLLQGNLVKGCNLSDYVLVMQWEEWQIGMVIHQVDDVLTLNDEVIETKALDGIISDNTEVFIAGIAKIDAGKIFLIDQNQLIRKPDAVLTLIWDAQTQLDTVSADLSLDVAEELKQEVLQQEKELQASKIPSCFYDLYCPSSTLKERVIFRQRADKLRQSSETLKVENALKPLAVIGFGNEYFGVSLELVREFTSIGNLTSIPCCPNHIVGNMNLRGEIVTLVDIRKVLHLPSPPIGIGSQTVVIQIDDIVAGLPVDQIWEMVSLNSADVTPLPKILSNVDEQYIQGTAFFQEKTLKILNLPKIFTQGELVVNEEA